MNIHSFEEVGEQEDGERAPVLAVRLGRGRTGGSTFLDLLIQRARRAGRNVIIGDGDKDPALANFYPPDQPGGARQPISADIADVADWITSLSGQMAEERASLVLDLGGGDRILEEHARDLALPAYCEAVGAEPLAIFTIGPDLADFEHVLTIVRAGYFKTEHAILVQNHSLVRAGKNAAGAFEEIENHSDYKELARSSATIAMPRLGCMNELRAAGLSFFEAASDTPVPGKKPFDPARRFMVRDWLNRIERQFEMRNILEWLP